MWFSVCSLVFLVICQTSHGFLPINTHPFPEDFTFGVSTAAYTVEGGWDQDGKCENIWDRIIHTNPEFIVDRSNADVAANAYNKLREDVELLNLLGVRHARLSLPWSRILPRGFSNDVNIQAIKHYRKLLELYRENQIEPFVTLYYWDLPQYLEDLGGFRNESFPRWFKEYADVCYRHFGDIVKHWFTFNEPSTICTGGYGNGDLAPGSVDPGVGDYQCGHNLLKAHAEAYHLYDQRYKPLQKGKISISLKGDWYEPHTDCEEDREASEKKIQFELGWFAHPLYIGNYPDVMIRSIGERCDGLSRLPTFTQHEIEFIRGTHDFFSLNHEDTYEVRPALNLPLYPPSIDGDTGVEILQVEGYKYGMRKILVWIKNNYFNPAILISENGYSSRDRTIEDKERIEHLTNTLGQVRDAKDLGARVYGYTYKSLMDNFEWTNGYTLKCGLFDVEFGSKLKTRTPRSSAYYYQHVAKSHCIVDPCPTYRPY